MQFLCRLHSPTPVLHEEKSLLLITSILKSSISHFFLSLKIKMEFCVTKQRSARIWTLHEF